MRDLPTLNEQFCDTCHSKKGKEKRKVQKKEKGYGYMASLQLADLYYGQNDLLGSIFGKIPAIADKFTSSTSKNIS